MSAFRQAPVRLVTKGAANVIRSSTRQFHGAGIARMPYKDDQDRESLKPRAQEYSKSEGGDNEAAKTDAAFNPNKTRPETEKKAGGESLDASPANKDISATKPQENNTSGQQKQKASGGGGRK
ncbi:hypothetical protein MCOR27_006974 [Pyricularia oryzae]|uniref:Uncharacterized protein n=4 Tax=Pyricularia TaxID=48558 RepID=A0ABQ8N8B0_PYRGI|nr:hypothetical protein OOU_Y34scaffold00683g24 [Pyricularia oryzae Y34]KAH8843551.1 hypothetical protein MCOR01_004344 [Pyricularia oryzae]KAI6292903.1 hypothetical protein MCOR33_009514 [Pyricularia grisea]KAH9431028.1 hypothetical protein MCOR02_008338 [Pyricularia oryzae]KAI6263537.1 hypothetical protein MCOR19_000173 [Pyricularia oryzae]